MKDKLVKEHYCWVQQILKTQLNMKNKMTAINRLALPVLIYSFRTVNWSRQETEKIDGNTRQLLTVEGIHHPKADVNRPYIKRWNGGHRLVELDSAYNAAIWSQQVQDRDRLTRLMQEPDTIKQNILCRKVATRIKQKCMKHALHNI